MSISVGSVQHYVQGSTWFDMNQYAQFGTQERVSINLASSNLWLVDSSKLFLQSAYAPRLGFLNEGAGYQSPIKLSASGGTTGSVTAFQNLSGYNSLMPNSSGPLWKGDWVQFSMMEAGTQLNLSVTPNGVFQPKNTPLSTDPSLNPVSQYNPNAPVFWAAYADPNQTIPLLILGYEDIAGKGSDNDFNDGLLVLDVGKQNFDNILRTANLGQNPAINLKNAKPVNVPFELTPTIGVVLVMVMFAQRLLRNCWKESQTYTQLIRSNDESIDAIAHTDS
ncbi:MAG: DUF4114 domain-containing protein [Leptolyngbya sp. BL-A-14]